MERVKRFSLLVVLLTVLGLSLSLLPVVSIAAEAPAKAAPSLSNDDCIKCHAGPPAAIKADGGKHKNVGCQDCHTGHRPASKNNIPECSQCHMGKPHFELKGCLNCHKNPHTPLKITFASNVTEPCLTCHTQQIAQLKEYKSKHSVLGCSTCHSVHRKIPECLQCHKPHSSTMVNADCKGCHKPHMPKNVVYADDISSKSCGACHKKALDLLSASSAKHRTFSCAFCHKEKHKMIPKCTDCHGTPHPTGMMAKYPKCGECHNIAHDLNHWPAGEKAEKKEAPKETKEIKKKKK